MKRLIIVGVLVLIASGLVHVSARADDSTTIMTSVLWNWSGDGGSPVTGKIERRRIVAAYGTLSTPYIQCSGPDCDPQRPARIELLRNGTWKTWAAGTLERLSEPTATLTAKRTTTVIIRSVLSAHGDLPQLVSPRWSVRFLPGTAVTLSGTAIINATAANNYFWEFRRGTGTIIIHTSPGAAGRIIEVRDASVERYPLIGRATTDAQGRASLEVDLSNAGIVDVTLLPTKERAGWTIGASPVETATSP